MNEAICFLWYQSFTVYKGRGCGAAKESGLFVILIAHNVVNFLSDVPMTSNTALLFMK